MDLNLICIGQNQALVGSESESNEKKTRIQIRNNAFSDKMIVSSIVSHLICIIFFKDMVGGILKVQGCASRCQGTYMAPLNVSCQIFILNSVKELDQKY